MSSVKTIAERVLDQTSGGRSNQDGWDLRTVMMYVGNLRDQLMPQMLREKFKEDAYGYIDPTLFVDYEADIRFDSSRELYYADLPARFVNLPFGMGVWSVSPLKDQINQYVPIMNGTQGIIDLVMFDMSHTYYIQGSRIYFNQEEDTDSKLLVKLIPAYTVGEENNDLEVPSDIEFQIMDEMVKRYSLRSPTDTANDGRNIN